MTVPYRIPAQITTVETEVAKSHFIATVFSVDSVDSAKQLLNERKQQMPDADHHVYAFRVGFGNSVIEGLSDDGEPTGTSGPPIMNVLRGSELGDTLIIVTRYFGGTKLGTGGLVRAYSEAAALAIKACPTILKIHRIKLRVLIDYPIFTLVKRTLPDFDAEIVREEFTDAVELELILPESNADALIHTMTNLSSGAAIIERTD